jgi:gluconolactonase
MKALFIALTLGTVCNTCITAQLIVSKDFTAENLFSRNIEGPAVDKNGQLFVVNYGVDGTIGKVNSNGSCELFVTLPEGSIANSIQFNSKGNMLLADFTKHNILQVDVKTKTVSVFANNPQFNQPNDLCINSKDQLFASDPNWKESTGKIWRINADKSVTLLADKMGTTNGIELSPDEKILYVNESVQRRVWAFDVDETGSIKNKRLFFAFDDFGMDGMKCDKEGNLYITRYGGGSIAVISPKGTLVREILLKGKNCSNLVFGGADGKTVFVTLQDRKGIETFINPIAGKAF